MLNTNRCVYCSKPITPADESCSHPNSDGETDHHFCSQSCCGRGREGLTLVAQCKLCGEAGEFGECEHVRPVNDAREWLAQNAHEQGEPGITLATEEDIRSLAGAVVDQHAEIEQLRTALKSALDIADESLIVPVGPDDQPLVGTWSGVITLDASKPYRDKLRIAELRRLLK